jgi:hypothetical protein
MGVNLVKMLKAEVQMTEEKRSKKSGRIIKWPKTANWAKISKNTQKKIEFIKNLDFS